MLLKEEKVNLGRQREFDIIKALSILFMVTVHVYEELTAMDYSVLCSTPFSVIVEFLGGPLAAPVFMFSLGLGLSYSKHRSPEDFIKRGVKLFLFAYLFSIIRFTIPIMISLKFKNLVVDDLVYETFHVDILQFAGLTFILTGILKKIKVSVFGVFAISLAMQCIGSFVGAVFEPDFHYLQYIAYLFFPVGEPAYFPLFQWYIYPALGLLFAKFLRHIENKDTFYKNLFIVAVSILTSLCGGLYFIGYDIRNLFALRDSVFYKQTLLHTIFSLCVIIIELSVVHFILNLIKSPKPCRLISFMSSKLNEIYIVQWMVIGWPKYLLFTEDNLLPRYMVVPFALGVVSISVLCVFLYESYKKKISLKKHSDI